MKRVRKADHDAAAEFILNNINCNKELEGLEQQYKQLHQLTHSMITQGENNTVLVTGPRSSGKTTLMRNVLEDLRKEHDFITIYLNALVYTDDKLALKKIATELSVDVDIEYKSFSEGFLKVFECLQTREMRPIVLVLDEFELYTTHPKQALLYNLFETVGKTEMKILLVGICCCVDGLQLLEKRVKSRFLQRHVTVAELQTMDEYLNAARRVLDLTGSGVSSAYKKEFDASIDELFEDKRFKGLAELFFQFEKNPQRLFKLLTVFICKLSDDEPVVKLDWIIEASDMMTRDYRADQLRSLAPLELTLMIATQKLMQQQWEMVNFEMVYRVYMDFMTFQPVFKKDIVYKAQEESFKKVKKGVAFIGFRIREQYHKTASRIAQMTIISQVDLPAHFLRFHQSNQQT